MIYYAKCGGCGSEFRIDDNRGEYINGGGRPDARGRVYSSQVSLSEFVDAHQKCLSPPKQPVLRVGSE